MVARQSGPMKMNHACRLTNELCTRMREWRSKKWRRIVRISSSRPFSFGLWTFMRYLTQRKQGSDGNPLRLKVCVRSTLTKQDSKSPCSSKATAWREDLRHSQWIQSGTVNLAKFTLIPPWHIFRCVNLKYVRVNRPCLSVLGGRL